MSVPEIIALVLVVGFAAGSLVYVIASVKGEPKGAGKEVLAAWAGLIGVILGFYFQQPRIEAAEEQTQQVRTELARTTMRETELRNRLENASQVWLGLRPQLPADQARTADTLESLLERPVVGERILPADGRPMRPESDG